MINDTCLKISTHPDVEDLSFTDVNADKLLSLASSCLEENAPSLRTNDSLSNSGETVHETDVCTQETEIKSLHTEKKTDQLNANKFLSKALGKVPCMKRRDVIDLATDEEKRSPNDRWFLNKFGSSGVNRCRKKWISTRDQSISQRTLMQVSLKTKLEEKRRCEQQKRQVVYDADNCEVISENTCGILDYDSKSSESETSEKEELNYIAKQDETASSNYIYGKKSNTEKKYFNRIDNVCLLTQKMQVHHIFQVDNVSDEKLLEDNEEKSNFGICTFRGSPDEICSKTCLSYSSDNTGSSDDMSSLGLGDNILVDTVAGSCDFHVHDYAARKLDASVKKTPNKEAGNKRKDQLTNRYKKSKKRRLVFSDEDETIDDESWEYELSNSPTKSEETENESDKPNEENSSDDELEVFRQLQNGKKPKKRSEFIEEEAALSGDDIGSDDDDDDEGQLDVYEAEEGDDDEVPDDETIKEQLQRQWIKQQQDEEDRKLLYWKDKLLKDGDLTGETDRTFRFKLRSNATEDTNEQVDGTSIDSECLEVDMDESRRQTETSRWKIKAANPNLPEPKIPIDEASPLLQAASKIMKKTDANRSSQLGERVGPSLLKNSLLSHRKSLSQVLGQTRTSIEATEDFNVVCYH